MAYSSLVTQTSGGVAPVSWATQVKDNFDAAFPVAVGAWTNWTPTLTQSGSVAFTNSRAKYMKVGRMVTLMAQLTVTGTGTGGNNVVIAGLPFAAAYSSFQTIGTMTLFDQSLGDDHTGLLRFISSSTNLVGLSTRASGTLGSVSFTAALAANDSIYIQGTYEAVS